MLEIIILSVSVARILITFRLPNVKPFNCLPCLTAWITLILLLSLDITNWYMFPIGYFAQQMIMSYESK